MEHHSFHARGLRSEHALHFAIRPRPCLDTRAQTLARKSFGGNSSHIAAGHSARRDRFDSAEAFTSFHLDTAFPLHAMLANETQGRREEILKALTEAARKYAEQKTGSVKLTNEALCVVGTK